MISNIKLILNFVTGKDITGNEIRILVRLAASHQNHQLYEYLLKKYDPFLDLPFSNKYPRKTFLDDRKGLETLIPYRVLESQTQKVFEKVYFNESKKLRSVLHLDEKQDELQDHRAQKNPRIVEVVKGEYLTVVHYEFCELNKLPAAQAYPLLKARALELS
jgi:hypothetical protein